MAVKDYGNLLTEYWNQLEPEARAEFMREHRKSLERLPLMYINGARMEGWLAGVLTAGAVIVFVKAMPCLFGGL